MLPPSCPSKGRTRGAAPARRPGAPAITPSAVIADSLECAAEQPVLMLAAERSGERTTQHALAIQASFSIGSWNEAAKLPTVRQKPQTTLLRMRSPWLPASMVDRKGAKRRLHAVRRLSSACADGAALSCGRNNRCQSSGTVLTTQPAAAVAVSQRPLSHTVLPHHGSFYHTVIVTAAASLIVLWTPLCEAMLRAQHCCSTGHLASRCWAACDPTAGAAPLWQHVVGQSRSPSEVTINN